MEINSIELWTRVVDAVADLPEAYEKLMFDTPAFYSGKKFFCRLKEDGETLVLYNNIREEWIEKNPDVFFFTDHYKNYLILLVDLKKVSGKELKELVINSWRLRSTKALVKSYGK